MIFLPSLTHLSPDAALLVLTAGFLLIYLELNRPGWIIPGATGLLLTLLSLRSLAHFQLRPPAIVLILGAAAVLLVDLVRPTHNLVTAAATIALLLGFNYLVLGPEPFTVHPLTAAACGLILGVATHILTTIARRARTNKRVRLA